MQAKLKNAVQALVVGAFVFASYACFYQAGKIDGAREVAANTCK